MTSSCRTGTTLNGAIPLYYEDWGREEDPAIVLIMGLSGQLIVWPDVLVQGLVQAGFRVIRFDNRDIGLSGKINFRPRMPVNRAMLMASLGLPIEAPYTLHDMALDTLNLINELNLIKAHIVGISMGGMISQILCSQHPERISSLSLLMTSPLSRGLTTPPSPSMLWTMISGGFGGRKPKGLERPRPEDVARFLDQLNGSGYRSEFDRLVESAERSLKRSYHPSGVARQMLAVLATGDISALTRKIAVPTQIIHGKDDPLISWKAGKRLAELIPGSRLHLVDGLGHSLPLSFMPELQNRILELVSEVQGRK